jgi:F-type H+-transporting ATPase subunit a
MSEQFLVTRLLNQILGPVIGPVAVALQHVLHITPAEHPEYFPLTSRAPFPDAFGLELCVALGLIAFFVLVRVSLSVDKPGLAQYIAEMLHDFVGDNGDKIIGHGYERFQPFVTCIFLFVVFNNLLGLVPWIETPTANPASTLGIALLTFLYYNYYGIKANGPVGYLKQFAGPMWQISWLLFPIEVVSHLARIMSLTIRLYANMFASDLVTLVFFSLVPLGIPAIFLGLHFGVSLIQAYVFMLLAMIYLSQAIAHEH